MTPHAGSVMMMMMMNDNEHLELDWVDKITRAGIGFCLPLIAASIYFW